MVNSFDYEISLPSHFNKMKKIITLKDIEKKNHEEWKNNCKKEVVSQVILNKLNKKGLLSKNQSKKIQDKITKFGKLNMNRISEESEK